MSISKSPLRTPLKKARGLGSAQSGVHHWWLQRVSALLMLPLSVWFMFALITRLIGADRGVVGAWLGNPAVAIAFGVLIIAMLWHAKLGLQVVIEDYVHRESTKIASLLLVNAVSLILGLMAVVAIAHLNFFGA